MAAPTAGPLLRRWRPHWDLDLAATLGPLRRGPRDPACQIDASGVWRATGTPEGPATVHYTMREGTVVARAWGPGAPCELAALPQVLGAEDDPAGFDPAAHPVMAAAFRRFGHRWRAPRTGRVMEALVPAVLEQRVTGRESRRAWVHLVTRFGQRAPGPGTPPLRVPPSPASWAQVPSWAWHRAGVDPGRAATVVAAAGRAPALERLSERASGPAAESLRSLPGIGAWTAAEVAIRAWGDIDAVSFGDYHLAGEIVHALTGARGGTDDQMAALLAPWAGQRARAVRMLQLHCPTLPRRGPRATITDHRRR